MKSSEANIENVQPIGPNSDPTSGPENVGL